MSDTYRRLPKSRKAAVDAFDTDDFDYLLKHQRYGEISLLYDLIAQVHSEGVPLSDDHKDVLLYPFRLWGKRANQVMFEFRKEHWDSFKSQKQKLTPQKLIDQRRQSIETLTSNQVA